jgi:hypothetical protein
MVLIPRKTIIFDANIEHTWNLGIVYFDEGVIIWDYLIGLGKKLVKH